MSAASVSVVIPAHNAERYLGEAIESALAQTVAPLEVVVVDDGSEDHTAEVARAFGPRVRCHSQPQSGIGAARNRCVELARGEFLAFLDSDDLWLPRKLELQLAAFGREPRPDLVFAFMRQFISPDLDEAAARRLACPEGADPGYAPSAVIARREVFTRVGAFATGLRVGEFVDWMARAREHRLREHVVPEQLVWRRIHGTNQTLRERESLSDFAHILKSALDRRRAEAGA
jgi:glycosyltransferase involved in cell wall biosynthesis